MEPKPGTIHTSSDAERARGRFVPWVIAGFFLSFVLLLSSFVWIAFAHRPSLVTENAYQKGLAYNQSLEVDAAQKALGWRAKLEMMDGYTLRLVLSDKSGRPVAGAKVKAWFVRPSQASMDQSVMMTEKGGGVYEAAMPSPAPGLWEARITAERGGKQFQAARSVSIH